MVIAGNESLKSFNTFGIDCSARHFARFSSVDDLLEILQHPVTKSSKQLVLGGGSNILLTGNYDGIVLKNELKGITLVKEDDAHFYVKAGAGEVWHKLVMHCITNNYAGLENLSLIPGCVGASPMQNIGAYGVEIKDVFESLDAIHTSDLAPRTFTREECKFGYRESVFKREEKGNWIITSVIFRLDKRPILHTSYGAIEEELDRMEVDNITIRDVSQAVINIRSSKLPDPAKIGNAGSFFKNPMVPISVYEEIKKHFNNAPCYPVNENEVKIPAGWMIEQCGWKGKTLGNYGVHKNQALVLVNYGGATGKQIYDLSTSIINDVKKTFNVELEREVNII